MSLLTNRIIESRNRLLAGYDRIIDALGRIKFTRLTTPAVPLPTSATITASPNPPSASGQTTYTVRTSTSWSGTLYISYYQDAAAGTGAGGTVPVSFNKSVNIVNGSGTVSFELPFPESISSYNTLYIKVYTTDGQSAIMGGNAIGSAVFTLQTATPTVPLPTSATITANPTPPSVSGQTTYTVRTNNSWSGTLYLSYYQDAAAGTGAGGTVPMSFNKSVAINNGTGSVSFTLPFPESVSSYNTLYVKVYTTDGQSATISGGAIGTATFTLQNTTMPTSATITASPNPPNVTGNTNYTVTTGNSWTGTLYLSYYQDAAAGTGAGGTVPVSFNKTVSIVNGSGTVAFPIPFPESVSSYNTLYVKVYTTDGQSAIMGGNAIGSAVFNLVSSVARTLRISNVAPDPLALSGNVSFNISSTGLANGTQVNWAINYLFRNSFIDDTAIYHNSVVTGTSTINNGSVYVSTPYPARNTGGKLQGYLNIKATTSNGSGGLIYSDDVNAGATFNMGGSSDGASGVTLYTSSDIYGLEKKTLFERDEITHIWVDTSIPLSNVVVTATNTWVAFEQADNTSNISPGKTYLGLALVAPSTPYSVTSVVKLTSNQTTVSVSFETKSMYT